MSSGKKKLAIFFLIVTLLAIPATSYLVFREQELLGRAAPATVLSFDPPETSKTVGDTFTLNVNIDTGSNSITGAELHIQYDQQKLQGISIANASPPFLPVVAVDGSTGSGFAFINLSQPTQPKKGAGRLATITFKAIGATGGGATFVKFTGDSRVAGIGEIGNVLVSAPADAAITINAPAQAATPTPVPSPTVTPSPTPTGVASQTSPTPTVRAGNIGIGTTSPARAATPVVIATVAPGQKGGLPVVQPTTPSIPVTADIGPTTVLAIGGALLFVAGLTFLLVL